MTRLDVEQRAGRWHVELRLLSEPDAVRRIATLARCSTEHEALSYALGHARVNEWPVFVEGVRVLVPE